MLHDVRQRKRIGAEMSILKPFPEKYAAPVKWATETDLTRNAHIIVITAVTGLFFYECVFNLIGFNYNFVIVFIDITLT